MSRNEFRALTDEEVERLFREVLENAGEEGLTEDELCKALQEVWQLAISEAMLTLWRKRELKFGWNVKSQDLMLVKA
ncbi:Uncharacterised protein [Mycobacteroides abscessus subsp. abscessus]|uniref:hypothetical protein n=1 Tax=Mycobacteroides abscessus TaxID=36809 RepID=UPI0009A5741B|nr:hypothetical protein [Mycobacteroides abscessus]SKU46470.1 Uncharacterised protein [Mycobacteroides abscessus subsp. abscessus]